MGLILVASEDTVEIDTIKAALSVHGWWVTVAADRETAIQAAADQAPKLVLVDFDLPGSIELVRAFGSSNGGPGVLMSVAAGFEGALELKEAGVDELITKPLSPPGLLEVVRRCLAGPRPAEVERPASTKQLLTTEEIFGDVLRELEGEPSGEAETPPTVAQPLAAPAPGPAPALTAARPEPMPTAGADQLASEPAPAVGAFDDPFDSPPASRPIVSLAGLFDEETEATVMAAPEPAPAWHGEERRGPERPWGAAAESSRLPAVDQLFADAEGLGESAEPAAPEPPFPSPDTCPDELGAVVENEAPVEEPEPETLAAEESARRLPRAALILGALATALLMAAGVVFLKNPGAQSTASFRAGEPGKSAATDIESPGLEAESATIDAVVEPPVEPPAALAELPVRAAPPSVEIESAAAPLEDLDLAAIVEQELERREEELRQVFLEEEKRLLRELNKLDESPPANESGGADSGADGSGGGS